MKSKNIIEQFLEQYTQNEGGYGVAHGWKIEAIETLLPAGIYFPKIFHELYNSYSFDTFTSGTVSFLGNNDGDASEIFEYYEANSGFVRECCELGYLPFARLDSGSYDPVCFEIKENKLSRGDFPISVVNHECILQYKSKIRCERIARGLLEFMKNSGKT